MRVNVSQEPDILGFERQPSLLDTVNPQASTKHVVPNLFGE